MANTSAWNTVVYCPRLKLSFLLVPWQYTPAPMPFFVLEPSVYQINLPSRQGKELGSEWTLLRAEGRGLAGASLCMVGILVLRLQVQHLTFGGREVSHLTRTAGRTFRILVDEKLFHACLSSFYT
jgi:hypothetical protein